MKFNFTMGLGGSPPYIRHWVQVFNIIQFHGDDSLYNTIYLIV